MPEKKGKLSLLGGTTKQKDAQELSGFFRPALFKCRRDAQGLAEINVSIWELYVLGTLCLVPGTVSPRGSDLTTVSHHSRPRLPQISISVS
jgi:hypothetical protein